MGLAFRYHDICVGVLTAHLASDSKGRYVRVCVYNVGRLNHGRLMDRATNQNQPDHPRP